MFVYYVDSVSLVRRTVLGFCLFFAFFFAHTTDHTTTQCTAQHLIDSSVFTRTSTDENELLYESHLNPLSHAVSTLFFYSAIVFASSTSFPLYERNQTQFFFRSSLLFLVIVQVYFIVSLTLPFISDALDYSFCGMRGAFSEWVFFIGFLALISSKMCKRLNGEWAGEFEIGKLMICVKKLPES